MVRQSMPVCRRRVVSRQFAIAIVLTLIISLSDGSVPLVLSFTPPPFSH